MAIAISHGTSADGTFSSAGATAWNAAHSISGLSSTSGALLYSTDATTLAQDGTNLLYTTASGPRLQVGSGSGTSAGWILGYEGSNSGYSALWPSSVTPSSTNMSLLYEAGNSRVTLSAPAQIKIAFGISTQKALFVSTAGEGPAFTSGTATTDVAALSVTRTNNNAAVATGVKFAFTDTTSAAGFLPFQVLGGAAGATNLFYIDKSGGAAFGSGLNINSVGSVLIPSASSLYFNSRGRMVAQSSGVWTLLDNAETSWGRLQFGGTTSSFPALKRSSAELQARLADDSDYAAFHAKSYSVNGTAGASFGPGAVASITVVNGIITAIS